MCKPCLKSPIKHRDSTYLTNIVPPGQDLPISHQILHHLLVVALHCLQNDKSVLLLLLQTSYCNTLWWCVIIYPHTLQ